MFAATSEHQPVCGEDRAPTGNQVRWRGRPTYRVSCASYTIICEWIVQLIEYLFVIIYSSCITFACRNVKFDALFFPLSLYTMFCKKYTLFLIYKHWLILWFIYSLFKVRWKLVYLCYNFNKHYCQYIINKFSNHCYHLSL